MCIIVDANRLGAFLADPATEDAAPIRNWLDRGGRIVYSTGGAFATEVGYRTRAKLLSYAQAGKAKLIPADQFAEDERAMRDSTDRRSDDPHVLALARWTGVRLLYTGDPGLIADFKNKKLVDRPRGKVYSRAANASLLTRTACTLHV
ncbi:MAG: hypothetical protein F4X11_02640 [Acidobacteria bacterium]|nr:hypothetical protein [Acidobacteriota bacterium]